MKKKKDDKQIDLSDSQSKGFRTKTASIMKSSKIHEDLRASFSGSTEEKVRDRLKGDKLMQ